MPMNIRVEYDHVDNMIEWIDNQIEMGTTLSREELEKIWAENSTMDSVTADDGWQWSTSELSMEYKGNGVFIVHRKVAVADLSNEDAKDLLEWCDDCADCTIDF